MGELLEKLNSFGLSGAMQVESWLIEEKDAVGVSADGFNEKDRVEREEILHAATSLIQLDRAFIDVVGNPDAEVIAVEVVAELMVALFPPVDEALCHRDGR